MVPALLSAPSTSRAQVNDDEFARGIFDHRGYVLDEPLFRMAPDCDRLYEVRGFEVAPCNGSLIPSAQADEAIRLKLIDFPELQDEFRLFRLQAAQDLSEVQGALEIEQNKNSDLTKLLDKNLAPPEVPFYETFWFGASVGVATTVIIVIAVSAAAR